MRPRGRVSEMLEKPDLQRDLFYDVARKRRRPPPDTDTRRWTATSVYTPPTDGLLSGFVSVVHDIDNELGEFSHIPKLVRGSAGGSGVEELSCGALLIHHRLNEVLAAALENLARPRD